MTIPETVVYAVTDGYKIVNGVYYPARTDDGCIAVLAQIIADSPDEKIRVWYRSGERVTGTIELSQFHNQSAGWQNRLKIRRGKGERSKGYLDMLVVGAIVMIRTSEGHQLLWSSESNGITK